MGTTVALDTSLGGISAYQAEPKAPAGGALVVIQEIFGVNAHIRRVTDRFAEQGFTALAPALFDILEPGVELGYDEAGVARGRELTAALGFDRAVALVKAAAGSFTGSQRAGAVGFCWGGTVAFLSCTRLGLPAVSYYGGRSVPFLHERAKAPLLFHFGERDALITPEQVAEHRRAQPQAKFYLYPAGHGFNCDQRADYDAPSAALALERTVRFFRQHLSAQS